MIDQTFSTIFHLQTKDGFNQAELDNACETPESPETAPLLGGPPECHDEDTKALNKRGGRAQFLKSCFVLSSGLFLLVVAFTIIQLGVLQQYVYYVYYKKYLPNVTYNSGEKQKSYCNNSANGTSAEEQIQNKIQVLASQYMIYASLALYIPPIFGNFFLVTLSDTFGRKPFIIIPIFGALLRSALFVIGIHFELDLQWFILFLLIEGATGGLYCQITVCFSYIADITEKGDKLIFLLVIIEVIAGLGGLIGTLSSGYLIREFGFILPSFISSLCLLAALLLLGVFLPESLPPEFKSRSKRINFLSKFKGVWEFYISSKNGSGTRWRYVFSLLILICVQFGIQGRGNVETLYELNKPFCWNSVLLGWFMAVRILSSYIIGLVLIRVLRCCVSVEFIALVGATSHMAAFILEAFAERTFELFLGKGIYFFPKIDIYLIYQLMPVNVLWMTRI